jgi:precorrin-4 methylase
MIQAVAECGDTLAIFMGLKDFENLVPLLRKYYPETTPVCLVYEAGFTGKERVIRTTLHEAPEVARQEKEKWLGLIYIGPCLESISSSCK